VDNTKIKVSEHFFSIQGEGPNIGHPALFLRLTACNLDCTWCDTTEVWRRGDTWGVNDLIQDWEEKGWLQKLTRIPSTSLVITGGEPLLQTPRIVELRKRVTNRLSKLGLSTRTFFEIETNCTLDPNSLRQTIDLFNCSPKLSNSGEPYEKRITEHFEKYALLVSQGRGRFKFVLSKPADLEEVLELINKFNIAKHKVSLMPEGVTSAQLQKNMRWLAEVCKEQGFILSPRLHVHIWEQTTGV
jgi:organic radical activating enzyme